MGAPASQGSRPGRARSTWRRRMRAGGTRRTARSGHRAHRRVTPTPMAIPRRTAAGETARATGKGTSEPRIGVSSGWSALPSAAPISAPGEAEPGRLEDVGAEDGAPPGAQALEDGDGHDLLGDEGAHARADADAAHEQRDQAREPEVARELVPHAPEPGLGLGVGGHAGACPHAQGEAIADGIGVGALGQLEQRPVPDAASRLHEARGLEVALRDDHARAQGEQAERAVGLVPDDPAHRELRGAKAEAVAGAQPEPEEKRLVHERPAAADQLAQGAIRVGHDAAVERVAGADRLQLHQQGARAAAVPGGRGHRGQLARAGRDNAARPEVGHRLGGLRRQRAGAADLDVAARERPGRAGDRAADAVAETADGDQGRHAEDDAGEHVGDMPPGAARLAPRHLRSIHWRRGERPALHPANLHPAKVRRLSPGRDPSIGGLLRRRGRCWSRRWRCARRGG